MTPTDKFAKDTRYLVECGDIIWQGRFTSFPMDEPYLLLAVAYVELNPVQAGMVKTAWDHPWSSVPAHLAGTSNGYVQVQRAQD